MIRSFICGRFGHKWSDWMGPVDFVTRDGLDAVIEKRMMRDCHRCNKWEFEEEEELEAKGRI